MTLPTAPCQDLATYVQLYREGKRVTVQIPAKAFRDPVAVGAEVLIAGAVNHRGEPLERTVRVRGHIKRVVVEVEIDTTEVEEPQHEGQGTLG